MPWFQTPDNTVYCAENPLIRTSNFREESGENGETVVLHDSIVDPQIPDRPSDRHVWTGSEWVIKYLPKWEDLQNKLRSTDLFAKAFSTSNQNAWSLLLHCFLNTSLDGNVDTVESLRLQDFQFALTSIRQGLPEDFSLEQVERFRTLLDSCDFPPGLI